MPRDLQHVFSSRERERLFVCWESGRRDSCACYSRSGTPSQYFYRQYNGGDLTRATPNSIALIGAALRLAFHDAAEYSPATFGVSDWYRADGCINTADPGNGGISASIDLLDVAWTTL